MPKAIQFSRPWKGTTVMNKSSMMLVTLGVLGASAIIRDSSVNRGTSRPGLETAARDRLVGTWELVSAEYTMKDGSKRPYPDVGRNGRGYLIYTSDGHMCAQLVSGERPAWKDATHPTTAEKVAAIDGLSAYCGRFEIDEERHLITHYPEVAWKPNLEHTTQPRYALEHDRLTFSDHEEEEPGALTYSIVWRRAKSQGQD
jgi:hypothetical protein